MQYPYCMTELFVLKSTSRFADSDYSNKLTAVPTIVVLSMQGASSCIALSLAEEPRQQYN